MIDDKTYKKLQNFCESIKLTWDYVENVERDADEYMDQVEEIVRGTGDEIMIDWSCDLSREMFNVKDYVRDLHRELKEILADIEKNAAAGEK